MTFVLGSLCLTLALTAAPQGQTIGARNGDLIVVGATSEVRVVRRGDANVRAIFNAAQRSLILLVDYVGWDGHEPDDRVDASYRFHNVEGEWPLGPRWQGRAIVEEYQLLGGALGTIHGLGLRTPAGLVQLLSGINSRSADLFAQVPSVALSYKGGGRGPGGEIPFDRAEAREVEMAARTAERLANPGSAGTASGVTFMINGVPVDVPSPSSSRTASAGATAPTANAPVRVGGNIRMPRRIVDAAPVMPEVARQAGIRGVVILEITIGTDGRVTDVKVLRSVQLLDQAAIDTAYQWRYEPTTLNGAPVPVIMTATVNFQ